MAGGKRAHKIQVNMGKRSIRNRDGRHKSINMGLDLASLATETGTSPETTFLENQPKQTRQREVSEKHGSQDDITRGGG